MMNVMTNLKFVRDIPCFVRLPLSLDAVIIYHVTISQVLISLALSRSDVTLSVIQHFGCSFG